MWRPVRVRGEGGELLLLDARSIVITHLTSVQHNVSEVAPLELRGASTEFREWLGMLLTN